MNRKIIAVGNIVMCDDGIGVKIAEFLKDDFRKLGFELVIGETDIDYCVKKIKDNDYIIVLDSSYYDIEPGSITVIPLNYTNGNDNYISQYGIDLLESLKSHNVKVNGFFITVEVSEIYFNPDLSPELESNFNNICNQCLSHVRSISQDKISALSEPAV